MRLVLLLVSTLAACTSASSIEHSPDEAPAPASDPGPGPTEDGPHVALIPKVVLEPAKDLALDDVSFYQGVKVPLVTSGKAATSTTAHVVEGREGLLRVHVAPSASWSAREVVLEVTVHGATDTKLTTRQTIASADDVFELHVPANLVARNVAFAYRLLVAFGSGDPSAKQPDFAPIETWDTGEVLKVKLVPVKAHGYLPDVSEAQIERYRAQLQAMYPVKKVEITVRETYQYDGVYARGTGIYGLLDAVTALRKKDGAPPDVYYYGVFTPTSSFSTYCIGSCTTGLCHLTDEEDEGLRACVGVGFSGNSSAETMAHELGHAHGLPHSPCGSVAGADSDFPYDEGKIGTWGWDVRSGKFFDPDKTYDFMSYCSPDWISDYAFDLITRRMNAVSKQKSIVSSGKLPYRFVRILPGGVTEWGSRIELDLEPSGEEREVVVDGVRVRGRFHPYGDGVGGTLLVRE